MVNLEHIEVVYKEKFVVKQDGDLIELTEANGTKHAEIDGTG